MVFTEGLALQLESGVPLHVALQSMQSNLENPMMARTVEGILQTIMDGGKFSDALSKHSQVFSTSYVNLIGASEGGGFLPEVLNQLVEMDEKQAQLQSTVASAMSYPAFLMFFSVAVVVFILTVVFPKFTVLFVNIYEELPITTKVLMAVSAFIQSYPLQLGGGAVGLVMAVMLLLRQPSVRLVVDRMKLRVPLLRDIFIKLYLTRLLRTMGVSLQRGVTVLDTLKACREVVHNAEIQSFIEQLEFAVTQGQGISPGFQRTSFIPATVKQMINTGEQAGELGHVMNRIADFYDRELNKRLNQLAKLAEPVMLLVMGGTVGVIVSSLILPIFKLSRAGH